jgi:alkaline phosphatase
MNNRLAQILVASRRWVAATALTLTVAAAWADAPKYVFFFIGDGMGMNHVRNAQLFKQKVLNSDEPLLMTTFPVTSFVTTNSASSDVTDSAAAGTALSTGHKTKNGMLGMGPDTTAVTSVAKRLFDAGYGVSLITTVAIDDATPGAFYTHVKNRGEFYDVGRHLAESGYQFTAGAGLRGTKDHDGNDNGLLSYFAQNNVSISYGLDNIDKNADKVLVLSPFHEQNANNVGYTVDSIAGALTLPNLTAAAIKHMQRVSPNGFFMMVEGGNIDHAGHGNDGGTVVREVINFDQSLALAYEFYQKHPNETLIIVTADHETGGMSVGCQATGYSAPVWNNSQQKVSKEQFQGYCQGILKSRMIYTWDDMKQYLADNLGFGNSVKPSDAEWKELEEMFENIFEKRSAGEEFKTLYASFNGFTTRVFDIVNNKAGYGWTSGSHTGAPVPVFAVGVGAWRFGHMMDNTDIPKTIMDITLGKKLD